MQKLLLKIEDCMPGMIVAEPVVNLKNGTIYIAKNQELTNEIINNLKNLQVKQVQIYVNTWDTVWNIKQETRKDYERCTQAAKALIENIASTKVIQYQAIQKLQHQMKEKFRDNHKVIGCINISKYAENYNYTHSINVALLCMLIGKWMKCDNCMINELMIAGLLHDIGKVCIDPHILNKPDKLTEAEFIEVKKHAQYAYELLQHNEDISMEVKLGILMHHERIDGSGYPYGTYGENINLIARILAVADVYDAMLSERPYQKKQSPFDVMQVMQEGIFGKLDTKILLTFLSHIANYYIGVYVLLNTHQIGEVVAINPGCVYRPIVKVQNEYIDLYTHRELHIVDLT